MGSLLSPKATGRQSWDDKEETGVVLTLKVQRPAGKTDEKMKIKSGAQAHVTYTRTLEGGMSKWVI